MRGPYSIELSNDYQNLKESFECPQEDIDLKTDSFKKFIKNQKNDFLEAASTILYYINKLKLKSVDSGKITRILSYLKPDIPKGIIIASYQKIIEFDLLNHELLNQNLDISKEIVLDKLDGLIDILKVLKFAATRH